MCQRHKITISDLKAGLEGARKEKIDLEERLEAAKTGAAAAASAVDRSKESLRLWKVKAAAETDALRTSAAAAAAAANGAVAAEKARSDVLLRQNEGLVSTKQSLEDELAKERSEAAATLRAAHDARHAAMREAERARTDTLAALRGARDAHAARSTSQQEAERSCAEAAAWKAAAEAAEKARSQASRTADRRFSTAQQAWEHEIAGEKAAAAAAQHELGDARRAAEKVVADVSAGLARETGMASELRGVKAKLLAEEGAKVAVEVSG